MYLIHIYVYLTGLMRFVWSWATQHYVTEIESANNTTCHLLQHVRTTETLGLTLKKLDLAMLLNLYG